MFGHCSQLTEVRWYENLGANATNAHRFDTVGHQVFAGRGFGFDFVDCEDLTGDGYPEVVMSTFTRGAVFWSRNLGGDLELGLLPAVVTGGNSSATRMFSSNETYLANSHCTGAQIVTIVDVDGDSDLVMPLSLAACV